MWTSPARSGSRTEVGERGRRAARPASRVLAAGGSSSSSAGEPCGAGDRHRRVSRRPAARRRRSGGARRPRCRSRSSARSRRCSWTTRRSFEPIGSSSIARAVADRVLGGDVGAALSVSRLALPVARRRRRVTRLRSWSAPEGGLVAEQLHGVDRLAVAADQQADVLAVDARRDLSSSSSTATSASRPSSSTIRSSTRRTRSAGSSGKLARRLPASSAIRGSLVAPRALAAAGYLALLLARRRRRRLGRPGPPPASAGSARPGKKTLTTACWPIVQTLVEIQ